MHNHASLKKFCIVGAIFSIIVGSLLHFIYNWSGDLLWIGFFSPISESIWEHFKLGFYSLTLYALLAYPFIKNKVHNYIFATAFSALLLNLIIFILFYLYTFFLGTSVVFIDISLYILACLVAFYVFYHLVYIEELPIVFKRIGLVILVSSTLLFVLFTIQLPIYEFFISPTP